jgi:glycosyltransferase involved in cell wall biosynthesis
MRGLATVIRDRLPLQCLLPAAYDWAGAIARARDEAGPFDVTVVLLSRLDPWVRQSLQGRRVLDAVDSLRRSAVERSKAAGLATRWLWRMEAGRMARVEQEAADAYDAVVVVSEEETSELARAIAVPNGIALAPLAERPRAFDFGFWGRLPYFANADAAAWLLDGIWPAIRALHPAATLVIGGTGASRALRGHASRSGVTLLSPVADMAAFARDIRVALMPLRYGTGQSNKILEAAEAGCGIVATPVAMRGLGALAPHARIESSASELARAAVDLLLDDAGRTTAAAALRAALETNDSRAATLERLFAIASAGAGA